MADPELERRCALPIGMKLFVAAFTILLVAAYSRHYGLANFLWFSNLALILVTLGVVLESRLPISMAAVGVFLPEVAWSLDFVGRLVLQTPVFGITEYFWVGDRPGWVRALTLYHLALPPALWWLTGRLGYDRRALPAWCALAGVVVVTLMLVGDPQRNINRLWGLGAEPQETLPRALYVLSWAIVMPLAIWWPTHRLFAWQAQRRGRSTPARTGQ